MKLEAAPLAGGRMTSKTPRGGTAEVQQEELGAVKEESVASSSKKANPLRGGPK